MNPDALIESIPGVGHYFIRKLNNLEITTLRDLIYHFPFRYDDFSQLEKIQNIKDGQIISVQGSVLQIQNVRTRTGKFLTRAVVADESGTIEVIWFNQPYLTQTIKSGTQITLSGKVKVTGSRVQLMSPKYEIIKEKLSTINFEKQNISYQLSTLHTGRLVPIYPETEGLSSKWIRTKIAQILPDYVQQIQDFLPEDIQKRQQLIGVGSALQKIHFPKTRKDAQLARKRLAFDELFLLQYLSLKRKKEWQEIRKAHKMKTYLEDVKKLIQKLPFTLTEAQKKAIWQMLKDVENETPTNRLLEGDVGSGKTVVAAAVAFNIFLNGFDVLLAAPTEILAMQHHKTFTDLLKPFGVNVGIWTKSKKQKGNITVGTHALLTTFTPDREVGLVIVDEQHRFGVAQRAKLLLEKSQQKTPHILTMTATPIPRTLALTLYGDLELSVLDQMPQGRQKISTFVVPNKKRKDAYGFIEKQVKEGLQAFIITPFVEPSESMETVKAATVEFEKLKSQFNKYVKLGLLHGKLKSKKKEDIINKFKAGKIHILVATPVVEVGIDVPNATIMMIESAERFGLAQLHQLRGRVGRSELKSYCFLFTDSHSEMSTKRLKSMEKIHVGFELAEIDLRMRGPGELFGFRQSGYVNLKLADLSDHEMIANAQQEAKKLLEEDFTLKKFPLLKQKLEDLQAQYIQPN